MSPRNIPKRHSPTQRGRGTVSYLATLNKVQVSKGFLYSKVITKKNKFNKQIWKKHYSFHFTHSFISFHDYNFSINPLISLLKIKTIDRYPINSFTYTIYIITFLHTLYHIILFNYLPHLILLPFIHTIFLAHRNNSTRHNKSVHLHVSIGTYRRLHYRFLMETAFTWKYSYFL